MTRTRIDWADWTWNPVWGCRGGCPYCYARAIARRFGLRVCGRDDFVPTWVERNFSRPFPRRPERIFVNSMSDVAEWEPEWTRRVLGRIAEREDHTFLFLTKHPIDAPWGAVSEHENALLGVTATDQRSYDRLVSRTPPRNFISLEPLHGPIRLWGIHRWIIVGAETGNRQGRVRPELSWLLAIRDYASAHGVPLFFKRSLREVWPAIDDEAFPQEYPPAAAAH